jgi:glycosyltransferase involved in cell wall biosynthesis
VEDLPLVYNLARVFVFPSRYEGFGLTPLEAMACGTPVISSSASSLPEVIADAGILIPPDDVEGFAHAIVRVTGDAQLRGELRRLGLRQAQKFSWERAAQATLRVYEKALMDREQGRHGGGARPSG